MTHTHLITIMTCGLLGCASGLQPGEQAITDKVEGTSRRMPAEWEPQGAVWLQWPADNEGARIQQAFVEIVSVLGRYEDVRLVVDSDAEESDARAALAGSDLSRVSFDHIESDSIWMRDNGPRYVEVDGQMIMQNWEFDGWGSINGSRTYARDNAVPDTVAELLGLQVEQVGLIHERGDLEGNGGDTVIVSWSVLSDRNPALSKDEITAVFEEAFGVSSVVYTEGYDPIDITKGHVDGMVRFVDEDTVVVGKDGSELLENVADQIAEQRPDLEIVRLEAREAALFMNYLVGDGYVLMGDSGDSGQNAYAQAMLEGFFPGRDVHFVDVDALWMNGGGVHCVTNDQPVLP
jgi:agmatine deiminase